MGAFVGLRAKSKGSSEEVQQVVGEALLGQAEGKVLNVQRRLLSPHSSVLHPLINAFFIFMDSQSSI